MTDLCLTIVPVPLHGKGAKDWRVRFRPKMFRALSRYLRAWVRHQRSGCRKPR
jgi:hypothetical protein